MSIYDQRDKPAYRNSQTEPRYAKNKHILKWWTSDHDNLMAEQIKENQWVWYWEITNSIIANTDKSTLNQWKDSDPICSKYAYYNVLMYFAIARADQLGLTDNIRHPVWKTCPLCNNTFIESSLPFPLIKRFGINRLNYCSPCLSDVAFQHSGNPNLSKQKILIYIQDLANALEQVPTQNFGEGMNDFYDMDDMQRLAVLKVLQRKPTIDRVKELFNSWFHALVESGVLPDGTRKTSRGIQTIARDGHACLSLGEKTIDDYLFSHGIPHKIEPHYPEGNYRADFLVNDVFIEYFGLTGNPEYDKKTKLKQRLCKKLGIRLISIYPKDLVSIKRLERKLAPILNQKYDIQ